MGGAVVAWNIGAWGMAKVTACSDAAARGRGAAGRETVERREATNYVQALEGAAGIGVDQRMRRCGPKGRRGSNP
jgi:hypothetical protein